MRPKALQRRATVPRHEALADLAKRQHGVVSVRQLTGTLGYSRRWVGHKCEVGFLHRLYTGVYAVGHTDLSPHGECLAAVLACGPRALLSHYSAAWLWGLARHSPAPFHVTGPSPRVARGSIRLHRSSSLTDADRALVDNIPVTSVARTLLDQAARVPERHLRRLIKRAEELGIFDLGAVHDVLDRNRGHHGARRLRRVLALYEPPPFTRSDFESLVYEAILAAGLPVPRVNYVVAGMEVDLYWPEHRFAVELDVFETHGTREAFEEDRIRREELLVERIGSTSVTGPRFEREPDAVLARLGRLLAERGPM
jgi:hypothetical protein